MAKKFNVPITYKHVLMTNADGEELMNCNECGGKGCNSCKGAGLITRNEWNKRLSHFYEVNEQRQEMLKKWSWMNSDLPADQQLPYWAKK
ncbi:MAG: hypothetical protein OXR68_00195 [Alphaproteobacteria bacterium]|nr:hypothetical protein [Alphaproteobacteria bacterium]MDD9919031.1 hypothetical protein [Alphaproteobacteria bacterium]